VVNDSFGPKSNSSRSSAVKVLRQECLPVEYADTHKPAKKNNVPTPPTQVYSDLQIKHVNLPKDSPIYPIKRINMKNSGNAHSGGKVFNDYYDGSGNQDAILMNS
jgi:hypothetical protein